MFSFLVTIAIDYYFNNYFDTACYFRILLNIIVSKQCIVNSVPYVTDFPMLLSYTEYLVTFTFLSGNAQVPQGFPEQLTKLTTKFKRLTC